MIDWQELTDFYNNKHQARCSTAKLLELLYYNMGSMRKVADYLGVSETALSRKMDLLHVARKTKAPFKGTLKARLMAIPPGQLEKMTVPEMAELVGYSSKSIYCLLSKLGITNYKHLPRGVQHAKKSSKKAKADKAEKA